MGLAKVDLSIVRLYAGVADKSLCERVFGMVVEEFKENGPSTTDSDSVGQRAGFVRLQICFSNICPSVANR